MRKTFKRTDFVKAGSKGGKNGSRADKVIAGRIGAKRRWANHTPKRKKR